MFRTPESQHPSIFQQTRNSHLRFCWFHRRHRPGKRCHTLLLRRPNPRWRAGRHSRRRRRDGSGDRSQQRLGEEPVRRGWHAPCSTSTPEPAARLVPLGSLARASRADRQPQCDVDHARRARPARPRAGEPGQTDHRPHRQPRPRHRHRPRCRPRRHRRADRARRRRNRERGRQRRAGRCSGAPRADAPAVGVVPGGSANVFARSLGISPDPIVATNQLVDLLSEHRRTKAWRRIGLMDCGERWGVFTAGMGVDGDVVAAVEAQRDKGRNVTASRYIRVAIREMLASARKEPLLTLHLPGRDPVPACTSRSCRTPARGPTPTPGRSGRTRIPPSRPGSAFSRRPA